MHGNNIRSMNMFKSTMQHNDHIKNNVTTISKQFCFYLYCSRFIRLNIKCVVCKKGREFLYFMEYIKLFTFSVIILLSIPAMVIPIWYKNRKYLFYCQNGNDCSKPCDICSATIILHKDILFIIYYNCMVFYSIKLFIQVLYTYNRIYDF